MSLVELYKSLLQFFTPQEAGRIIQKAVINKLFSFLIHGEKEVMLKHGNLFFYFKADALLYINNKFVILEVKTGKSRESMLQKIVKNKVIYCLIRIDENEIFISCEDSEIQKVIEEKLRG